MENQFIDIHTHRPQNGVKSIFAYSLGIDTSPPEGSVFCAGIHPWSALGHDFEAHMDYLEETSAIAIGEIGLDYAKNIDRDLQKKVFRAQLELAQRRGLPVIIHCVRALDDTIRILKDYTLRAVIIHSFIGNKIQAATICDRGYYLSLGEVSLQSSRTVDALSSVPLDRLFAETDTSDVDIKTIYEQLADIYGIKLPGLVEIIQNNYKTIFG